jgi:hypothetical protein
MHLDFQYEGWIDELWGASGSLSVDGIINFFANPPTVTFAGRRCRARVSGLSSGERFLFSD